ncbi:MAG: hypothetical protein IKJ99_09765 [Oscillospiraceae bacterium]|nr:hypothetical protein [Oscillospiraceae bacterium]
MEKRTLLLVGIPLAGALAVVSLLFFWLAPDVECRMLVYGFGMGVITVQGIGDWVLWHFFGGQKAAPMMVSGTAFALGILTAGGVMLALNAPFRTALYYLIVFSVLYLISVGFLSCLAADELWESVENAMLEVPSIRSSMADWLRDFRSVFSRRRPGETEAERYERSLRPESDSDRPSPPPLPGRRF